MVQKKLTTKDLNKVLRDVLNIEPLIEFAEPMPEADHEMKFGLGQIYGIKGYRDYLIRSINLATKNAALGSDNEIMGAVLKGRLITLKELLLKSEQSFKEIDKKVKLLKDKENAKG